jgi:hypothetical protein
VGFAIAQLKPAVMPSSMPDMPGRRSEAARVSVDQGSSTQPLLGPLLRLGSGTGRVNRGASARCKPAGSGHIVAFAFRSP